MSDPRALTSEALASIAGARTENELAAIEVDHLGRKNGRISVLLSGIGKLPPAERAALGLAANEAKRTIEAKATTAERGVRSMNPPGARTRNPVTPTGYNRRTKGRMLPHTFRRRHSVVGSSDERVEVGSSRSE